MRLIFVIRVTHHSSLAVAWLQVARVLALGLVLLQPLPLAEQLLGPAVL